MGMGSFAPSGRLARVFHMSDGNGPRSVEESSGKEAFEIGRKLLPGCRLAGVMREGDDETL